MLIITDYTGATEALKVADLQETQQLGQVTQLDFTTWNEESNLAAYNMLSPRCLVELPETGDLFRVTENDGATQGTYYSRSLTFLSVMQDLDDKMVHSLITGSQSLQTCMNMIVSGTKFTYTIHDNIGNHDFGDEGFGNGHGLDLFLNTLSGSFNFEWTNINYHIDIYRTVGRKDAFVFVDGDDVSAVAETQDYTTITTKIHGEGKHDDNDKPVCIYDYTNPNVSIYGEIEADDFQSDSITTVDQLKQLLPSKVQSYPKIQYTANLNTFGKASPIGVENDASIGNYGYLRTRSGVDVNTRITAKTLYLQNNHSISTVTFGNLKEDPAMITASLRANHNQTVEEIKQIKNENNHLATGVAASITALDKVGDVND
ncbi:phage tail protein [Lactiplantibacillus pingfangensis]|uniref:phage tail protein n=1 Tax=Lactiplantibacillus TaxID=2767842 RepID=UPI0010F70919|nr:phage tail protein [Lactiplantibacillus pingfangensis]